MRMYFIPGDTGDTVSNKLRVKICKTGEMPKVTGAMWTLFPNASKMTTLQYRKYKKKTFHNPGYCILGTVSEKKIALRLEWKLLLPWPA